MPSTTSTTYKPRFLVPELLERSDQATTLRIRVYEGTALAYPSAGTLTVYDGAGDTVVDGMAVTAPGSGDDSATYSIPATDGRGLADGWSFVWALTMPDGEEHTFPTDGALVKWRGTCTVTHADVVQRIEGLDPSARAPMSRRTNWDPKIEEAWAEFQNDLIEKGRRPWLILSTSQTRRPVLYKALELILEDLGSRGNVTALELARTYGNRYADAMAKLTLRYDLDEDGTVDDPDHRTAARSGFVWGTGGGTSFGATYRRRG